MERITSVGNARIKRLVSLRQKARTRRETKSFVIEGIRLFQDTPDSFIKEIYIDESFFPQLDSTVVSERLSRHEVFAVTPEVFTKISDTVTPQGMLAVVRMPEYSVDEILNTDRQQLILLLEDIQDPGNLGTMLRTAEAAGADGVIMSRNTADVFNPKVVRSTMSAVFRVPFAYTDDMIQTVRQLQEKGTKVFAACLEDSEDYAETDYLKSCAVLIGNEGSGLKKETAAAADRRVVIPMKGEIESLNAAVSAAVIMFEAQRQRRLAVKRRNIW